MPRQEWQRIATVWRDQQGNGSCHFCATSLGKQLHIECLCRTAKYCSTTCVQLDRDRHAPDCQVIRAARNCAWHSLQEECCVCWSETMCSASHPMSTGVICQNGHCVCRKCYDQLPQNVPVLVSAPHGLTIRSRTCPLCRCPMIAKDGSTQVFDDITRTITKNLPAKTLLAETLVRWNTGKDAKCCDALQNDMMKQVNQPQEVQLLSGAHVLANGGGAYAVHIFVVHAKCANGPLIASTAGVSCKISDMRGAVRWAALHGVGRAKLQYGRMLLRDAQYASQCQAYELFKSAMNQGELTSTICLAVVALLHRHPVKAFYLLSKVPRRRWVTSAHNYGNCVLMLLANLAYRFGRWAYCIECIALCSPGLWPWWVIGTCLRRMARIAERFPLSEHSAKYCRALDIFQCMVERTERGTHYMRICVPRQLKGAMMAWAHGAKLSVLCALAAAYCTSRFRANWVCARGREPAPLLYLRWAARLGSTDAMVELGQVLLYHPFVGPKRQEALCWLEKAAQKGNRRAEKLHRDAPPDTARRCSANRCLSAKHYVPSSGFSHRQLQKKWFQRRCRNCIAFNRKSARQPLNSDWRKANKQPSCILRVYR